MKTIHISASALVAALILVGCNNPASDTASTTQGAAASTIAPTTAQVKKQDLTGYTFFDGKLIMPAGAVATAYSPYDTPVVSVSGMVGKYVNRGEPIVKLTIPGADTAETLAKTDVMTAKTTYADSKASVSGPVEQAKQELADAQAAEKQAKDTVASGGTADVDGATQARIAAESALTAAQTEMKQQLQPNKDALNMSAEEMAIAKQDAAKGIVRAPIGGMIVSMDAKPGMQAQAKQGLATIVNYGLARVQATVPPALKDQVKRHDKVIVAFNTPNSDPVEGVVTGVKLIPPAAGQTGQGYSADIALSNTHIVVPANAGVKRVGVKTGSVHNALVVPVGAVRQKDGKSVVSLQKGSDWVDTEVTTGLSDGALIEIKSGVNEGDTVRVQG